MSKHKHIVNILGYRQTKLLIALGHSLFYTNSMAEEVEFMIDNGCSDETD